MRSTVWLGTMIFALGLFSMSACMNKKEPLGDPYTKIKVLTPAPEARADTVTAPPGEGYVWASGHWVWVGENWVWKSGKWKKAKEGFVWVNPRYEEQDGQSYYILGGWVQEEKPKNAKESNYATPEQNEIPNENLIGTPPN